MSAYWLTYRSRSASSPRGMPAEDLSELVRRFEVDPASATTPWRIASYQTAQVGDRIYVFKQGSDPRGVFGVGEIIEPPRLPQTNPTDIDEGPRHRVKIRFDLLVDPSQEFLLDYETTQGIVPETLIAARASGNGVPEGVATELERRLSPFLAPLPPVGSEQSDDPSFDPDSVQDERARAIRAIRLRRGQPAFRAALRNYGVRSGGCA
jgi:putative restriction endonuclease